MIVVCTLDANTSANSCSGTFPLTFLLLLQPQFPSNHGSGNRSSSIARRSKVLIDIYCPGPLDNAERDKLVRALGPHSTVLVLAGAGALCCGATLEEAFSQARNLVAAAEVQLRLAAVPLDDLALLDDETRRQVGGHGSTSAKHTDTL